MSWLPLGVRRHMCAGGDEHRPPRHVRGPVDVDKERYGFSVDGVICEYAEVLFNGALLETACAESEDYSAMKEVIDKLQITDFENTNYLIAAKRVVKI